MLEQINLLGLGIDSGQKFFGPSLAIHLLYTKPKFFTELFNFYYHEPVTQLVHDCVSINQLDDLNLIDWTPYIEAYRKIYDIQKNNTMLVNWGGDHSVGLSTVAGFLSQYNDGHVIWIDAHADLNLPQYSPTGNFHGMPLAFLLNIDGAGKTYFPWIPNFLQAANLTYIGVRDLDPFEKRIIAEYGIQCFSPKDIELLGPQKIIRKIQEMHGSSPAHVSFDIDCVSPEFAPSTGVRVPNGLTPAQVRSIGRNIVDFLNVKSVDIVEINPMIGSKHDVLKTHSVALHFLNQILTKNHQQRGRTHAQLSQLNS